MTEWLMVTERPGVELQGQIRWRTSAPEWASEIGGWFTKGVEIKKRANGEGWRRGLIANSIPDGRRGLIANPIPDCRRGLIANPISDCIRGPIANPVSDCRRGLIANPIPDCLMMS